jgi:chitodextrinase
VTSLVDGDGPTDFALVSTSTDGVELHSKEHTNPAKRPSLEVTFATPYDDKAPTAPADLTAEAAGPSIALAWTAATDNVAVTNYEIYRNGELLAVTDNVTTYTDTTALVATPYEYTVKALDVNENRSEASNTASATVPDTQSPTAPENLRATAGVGQIALAWDAASDNIGVTGYRVYRGGTEVASVDGTSHTVTGPAAGTHTFTVRAIDAAGNLSGHSASATATVPDTDKPSAPSNLSGVTSPGQVVLSWDGSTDNVGVAGYRIYRNGTQVGSVLGNLTTFTHTNLNSGTYSYTVRAVDGAGNVSDASNVASVTVPDSIRPTAPGNLRATAGTGQVVLRWNASSDNIGVTGYKVYRSGTEVATVAGNILTYTHTGVAGPLSYTVRASDAAGNLSNPSNTATVTVADTVKPTAPANLTATGGMGQAVLNWQASTDNAGVTGYRVYRGTAQIASVNGTTLTYTNTGLAAGTYSYTVRARDAAGNLSNPSNTASATVTAPPTPGTVKFSPVADARVEEANAATNFGTATSLKTVAGTSPDMESYLKFEVSGVPGPVKTAKLRLTPLAFSWDAPGVHSAPSAWTESGVTWSNRPARGTTAVADKSYLWQPVEYDVKSLVTGNGTVSFALVSTMAYAADFGSREHADAAKRPQLIITY